MGTPCCRCAFPPSYSFVFCAVRFVVYEITVLCVYASVCPLIFFHVSKESRRLAFPRTFFSPQLPANFKEQSL
jgi:hypothetical protein